MNQPLDLRPKYVETRFARCYSDESMDELLEKLAAPQIGDFIGTACDIAARIALGNPKNRFAIHGTCGRTGISHGGHEVWFFCVAEIDLVAWDLEVLLFVGPHASIKSKHDAFSKEGADICKRDPKRARFVQRESL